MGIEGWSALVQNVFLAGNLTWGANHAGGDN